MKRITLIARGVSVLGAMFCFLSVAPALYAQAGEQADDDTTITDVTTTRQLLSSEQSQEITDADTAVAWEKSNTFTRLTTPHTDPAKAFAAMMNGTQNGKVTWVIALNPFVAASGRE